MDKKYEGKKKEYVERRREKIASQRSTIKESRKGDPTSRRLFFLEDILRTMGLNQADFARATGNSQQRISWMFSTSDDSSLSFIQESMEKLGVRIVPEIEGLETGNRLKASGVRVKGALPGATSVTSSGMKVKIIGRLPRTSMKSTYIDRCIEVNGRMAFLARFVKDTGLSPTAFSRRVQLDPSGLRFLFENDDTKISQLLRITKAFGCTLTWTVEALETPAQTKTDGE